MQLMLKVTYRYQRKIRTFQGCLQSLRRGKDEHMNEINVNIFGIYCTGQMVAALTNSIVDSVCTQWNRDLIYK
jgi:hypothetical protein